MDPRLRDLLARMLVKDPARRCTAEEMLQHSFIQETADVPATVLGDWLTGGDDAV